MYSEIVMDHFRTPVMSAKYPTRTESARSETLLAVT